MQMALYPIQERHAVYTEIDSGLSPAWWDGERFGHVSLRVGHHSINFGKKGTEGGEPGGPWFVETPLGLLLEKVGIVRICEREDQAQRGWWRR